MPETIYRILALRLREERRRAAYTLERLGELAGVGGAFIAHIEAERKRPTLDTVAKLARALGTTAADLLREEGADEQVHDADRIARLLNGMGQGERRAVITLVEAARDLSRQGTLRRLKPRR